MTEIRPILTGKEREAALRLWQSAFSPALDWIILEKWLRPVHPGHQTVVLGKWDDEKLLGVSAFMPYLFGEGKTGWQIVWSATHPDERGKGHFHTLVAGFRDNFMQDENEFLFAFPYEHSGAGPIYKHKLGFRFFPFITHILPSRFTRAWMQAPRAAATAPPASERMRARFLAMEKQAVSVENEHGVCWGITRIRKTAGLEIPYFLAGEIRPAEKDSFVPLMRSVFSETRTAVLRWGTTESHPLAGAFRIHLKNAEPLCMWAPDERLYSMIPPQVHDGFRDSFGTQDF